MCVHPRKKEPGTCNFSINLVKISKELCNLGSFVLFTIPTNLQAVCNFVFNLLKRKCHISVTQYQLTSRPFCAGQAHFSELL